jgi:adenylylsulfate kinase
VITPRRGLRAQARSVIGEDYLEVFVKADYATCAARDPKGLYAKADAGQIKQFTGKDSGFEEPEEEADLILDTNAHSAEECAQRLLDAVMKHAAARASTGPPAVPPFL